MKLLGLDIVENVAVPRDEIWIVQGPEQFDVRYADGWVTVAMIEPAKILARIEVRL